MPAPAPSSKRQKKEAKDIVSQETEKEKEFMCRRCDKKTGCGCAIRPTLCKDCCEWCVADPPCCPVGEARKSMDYWCGTCKTRNCAYCIGLDDHPDGKGPCVWCQRKEKEKEKTECKCGPWTMDLCRLCNSKECERCWQLPVVSADRLASTELITHCNECPVGRALNLAEKKRVEKEKESDPLVCTLCSCRDEETTYIKCRECKKTVCEDCFGFEGNRADECKGTCLQCSKRTKEAERECAQCDWTGTGPTYTCKECKDVVCGDCFGEETKHTPAKYRGVCGKCVPGHRQTYCPECDDMPELTVTTAQRGNAKVDIGLCPKCDFAVQLSAPEKDGKEEKTVIAAAKVPEKKEKSQKRKDLESRFGQYDHPEYKTAAASAKIAKGRVPHDVILAILKEYPDAIIDKWATQFHTVFDDIGRYLSPRSAYAVMWNRVAVLLGQVGARDGKAEDGQEYPWVQKVCDIFNRKPAAGKEEDKKSSPTVAASEKEKEETEAESEDEGAGDKVECTKCEFKFDEDELRECCEDACDAVLCETCRHTCEDPKCHGDGVVCSDHAKVWNGHTFCGDCYGDPTLAVDL